MSIANSNRPYLGHGVGLRERHYNLALRGGLDVDWIEVISENFFGPGGRPRAVLSRVRQDLPVALHGVSLGIGSPGGPLAEYLSRLRELCDFVEPAWVSDHLCWTHLDGAWSHELLPLPRVQTAIDRVVDNVGRVQDALRRRILLENVSTYLTFTHDAIPEWEFLATIATRADCLILLDLNNILVSAHNHGFDPSTYLAGIPVERVWQFHLARHSDRGNHRFDDHGGAVPDDVWGLFDEALRRMGPVSSLVEWDDAVPAWDILRAEQRAARARADAVIGTTFRPGMIPEQAPWVGAAGSEGHGVSSPRVAHDEAWVTCLQRRLWAAVMPTAVVHDPDPEILPEILETSRFPRRTRLSVYAQSIFWRLRTAVVHDFPVLSWVLQADFDALVRDFLETVPSKDPDLGRFGAGLPSFLAAHPLGIVNPALIELARLEHALVAAIDASDPLRSPTAVAELRGIPRPRWPELCATPGPGFAIHVVSFDPFPLWQGFADNDTTLGPAALAGGRSHPVVVWRQGFEVFHRGVEPAEAALLRAWLGGVPLAQAMGEVAAEHRLEPEQIALWLERWLHDGLVVAVWDPGGTAGPDHEVLRAR